LRLKFHGLELIIDDFVQLNLQELKARENKKLRIVGNIPYNLTSPILFHLIKYNNIVRDSVLMVQQEVAKRMSSSKGTKDYGILSVILKYFADVKYCFKVSPNVFYPKPKVDSAVVHIRFKDIKISTEEKQNFINTVKASFGNRRKTLKNSLSNSIFKELNFADSGIDLSLRAEQLDLDDFLRLAEFTLKYKNRLA
jgi:16S rRNA (adenine1518-N6/adenine1519-N6)-dimethyltransferase